MRPVALALASALLLSCSSGSSRPDPDDDKPDGKVIWVSGQVTAQRRGSDEIRTLEQASVVYGNDTVSTGEASSVEIELMHNQALLSLGASMELTLDETLGWRARRGAASALDEAQSSRTAAAGRHAERQAGETRATAAVDQDDVTKKEVPATEVAPGHVDFRSDDEDWRSLEGEDGVPPPADTGKSPAPDQTSKGPDLSETRKMREYIPTDKSGGGKAVSGVSFARVEAVRGKPSEAATAELTTRLERAYASPVRTCCDPVLLDNPLAMGEIALELEIGPDGRVTSATAKGFDAELAACIQKSAAKWTFDPVKDAASNAIQVTVRVTIAVGA